MPDPEYRAWSYEHQKLGTVVEFTLVSETKYMGAVHLSQIGVIGFEAPFDVKLMQWTGLFDVEDNMIYEGDVIEFDVHYSGDHRNPAGKALIVWEAPEFYAHGNCDPSIGSLIHNEGRARVIGNAFENPELLDEIEEP